MTTVLKALILFAVLASVQCKGAKKAKQEEPAPEEHEDASEDGAGEHEEGGEEGEEDTDTGAHDAGDEAHESLTAAQLRKMHAKFDANSDGKVSFEEILAFSKTVGKEIALKDGRPEAENGASMLTEIDVDKDGKVSLEEHLKDVHSQHEDGNEADVAELENIKGHEAEKFKAADANGDGQLDKDELSALFFPEHHDGVLDILVAHTMRKKDTDKDGKLTVSEFWPHDKSTDGHDQADISKEEKADFAKLDRNNDGLVDAVELRAWESGTFHTEDMMTNLFKVADKDGDKHITADEMATAATKIAKCDANYHIMEWAEHHEI